MTVVVAVVVTTVVLVDTLATESNEDVFDRLVEDVV
jgi:hypothetical protein